MQVICTKKRERTKWLAVIFLVGLSLIIASGQWHRNQTVDVEKVSGDAIPGSTTWADEQATRWFVPKPGQIPKEKVESTDPKLSYAILQWKTQEHRYQITVSRPVTISENTMYYPGWKVFVDGNEVPVKYQDSKFPGRLVFDVGSGKHEVTSRLTETPFRKAADWLSLGTLGLIVVGLLFPDRLFRHVVAKIFAEH